MVRERYLAMMREELAELAPGRELSLVLRAATPAAPRQLELPHQSFAPPLLNRRFIFDRFVAGTGNELACAAAKAMAQGSRLFSSTLFLVSGTGLGKSHLTQAVGHQVLAASPGARVAYLTAEEFTNQMIAALRHKRIEAFKERYRRDCDLLLLEEVQFLAGKDKTQDELGYTLDALLDAGKRVVFSSPQPACQIKGLKSALQSRLSGGVTVAIDPPDQRTRLRILERMAADEGVRVAPPVLEYLASEVVGDVRRLQSALLGCLAQGSLGNRTLDLGLAAEVLGQLNLRLKRLSRGDPRPCRPGLRPGGRRAGRQGPGPGGEPAAQLGHGPLPAPHPGLLRHHRQGLSPRPRHRPVRGQQGGPGTGPGSPDGPGDRLPGKAPGTELTPACARAALKPGSARAGGPGCRPGTRLLPPPTSGLVLGPEFPPSALP